jgi:hypothetical protein
VNGTASSATSAVAVSVLSERGMALASSVRSLQEECSRIARAARSTRVNIPRRSPCSAWRRSPAGARRGHGIVGSTGFERQRCTVGGAPWRCAAGRRFIPRRSVEGHRCCQGNQIVRECSIQDKNVVPAIPRVRTGISRPPFMCGEILGNASAVAKHGLWHRS